MKLNRLYIKAAFETNTLDAVIIMDRIILAECPFEISEKLLKSGNPEIKDFMIRKNRIWSSSVILNSGEIHDICQEMKQKGSTDKLVFRPIIFQAIYESDFHLLEKVLNLCRSDFVEKHDTIAMTVIKRNDMKALTMMASTIKLAICTESILKSGNKEAIDILYHYRHLPSKTFPVSWKLLNARNFDGNTVTFTDDEKRTLQRAAIHGTRNNEVMLVKLAASVSPLNTLACDFDFFEEAVENNSLDVIRFLLTISDLKFPTPEELLSIKSKSASTLHVLYVDNHYPLFYAFHIGATKLVKRLINMGYVMSLDHFKNLTYFDRRLIQKWICRTKFKSLLIDLRNLDSPLLSGGFNEIMDQIIQEYLAALDLDDYSAFGLEELLYKDLAFFIQ